MFAAHDQENLVSIHQTAANNKQLNQNNGARALQPKTPGAHYPKTPLKIPLNDENVVRGFGGGKSVLAGKTNGDRSQWVTPAGEHFVPLCKTSKQHGYSQKLCRASNWPCRPR